MLKFPYTVSVVFPACNEEANIEPCVIVANALLAELVEDYEIIVVDDGSTDRTSELVQALQTRYPKVRCIAHETNLGYGAALRTGFAVGLHEYFFFSDSDRQFDIFNLKDLLTLADRYDIVIGYRKHRQDPVVRKIAAFGYNQLVSVLFGLHIRDIDCAFKLFKRHVFETIHIQSQRYFVNTEILAKATLLDYTIAQVPVAHFARTADSSKVGPEDILRTMREMVRIRRQLADFRRDIHGRRATRALL